MDLRTGSKNPGAASVGGIENNKGEAPSSCSAAVDIAGSVAEGFADVGVVVEPLAPFARWLGVLCCWTLQMDLAQDVVLVVQTGYASSLHRSHSLRSGAVSVSWHLHLRTSYQVIACQSHQPDPKMKPMLINKPKGRRMK